MPSDAELAAVGYSAGVLNAFACEVEQALVELAQRHEVLAEKYLANSRILTDPNILLSYVLDFNDHVDPNFLNALADTLDQERGQQAQANPTPSAGFNMGVPGQIGNGMITPEMLRTNEVNIPTPKIGLSNPVNPAMPYMPTQMPQVSPQVSQLQPINQGRMVVPGPPGAEQPVTTEQLYSAIRQEFALNPSNAWIKAQQIYQAYGPQALAKPLVSL
jgi:hypothetical protein